MEAGCRGELGRGGKQHAGLDVGCNRAQRLLQRRQVGEEEGGGPLHQAVEGRFGRQECGQGGELGLEGGGVAQLQERGGVGGKGAGEVGGGEGGTEDDEAVGNVLESGMMRTSNQVKVV